MTEEKSKWVKYGSIFAIIIMLVSAVLVGLMYFSNDDGPAEYFLKDFAGTHTNFTFKNAKDGVNYLPEGVLRVDIIKVYPESETAVNLEQSFPGVTFDKVMIGSYDSGGVEYYSAKDISNGKIALPETPRYENYSGYSMIIISPAQRIIAGNPIAIATYFNYSVDNTLGRKMIDVLNKKSTGSTDFNDILSYADDTEVYDQISFSKVNGNFSKSYQRSSYYENGTIQLESIIYNPQQAMKDDIEIFAVNSAENVTVSVTENGPAMKIYVTSPDYISFAMKANELYGLIASHTVQENSTA
jgi:hypothetical protein